MFHNNKYRNQNCKTNPSDVLCSDKKLSHTITPLFGFVKNKSYPLEIKKSSEVKRGKKKKNIFIVRTKQTDYGYKII